MIKLIFISVQLIGLIVSFAVLYKIFKRRPPCESCEHLACKGSGFMKYHCCGPHQVSGYFEKARKYCKYYTPRQEGSDERKP